MKRNPLAVVSILARPEGRALLTVQKRSGSTVTVSILARPEGRALLTQLKLLRTLRQFQSSPAPKDGRYDLTVYGFAQYLGFNPRPPRRTGATMVRAHVIPIDPKFQSSPAPKDGRYCSTFTVMRCHSSFNPRPPRRTGATSSNSASSSCLSVSILARPEGRALPMWSPQQLYSMMFQSSPAPKDGRYSRGRSSITPPSWFQSSPAPKDGRYVSC